MNTSRFLGCSFRMLLWMLPLVASSPQFAAQPSDAPEGKAFAEHCVRLLKAAFQEKATFAKNLDDEIRPLLYSSTGTSEDVLKLQTAIDGYCLIQVSINPESRVKAARGAAAAVLQAKLDRVFLIKVQNEAGVTDALKMSSPQLESKTTSTTDGWLAADVLSSKLLPDQLTGQPVQYVLVRLRARETGKREATLKFDVGQGTQDLGFRAEVPVLFEIQP